MVSAAIVLVLSIIIGAKRPISEKKIICQWQNQLFLSFICLHISLQIYNIKLMHDKESAIGFQIHCFSSFVRNRWLCVNLLIKRSIFDKTLTYCFGSLSLDVLKHFKRVLCWTQQTCSCKFFQVFRRSKTELHLLEP